jgi:hypothetical protein
MAVLALKREQLSNHPRVVEGLKLIADRAIPSGGWNYGNKLIFGHVLRPQPGPTGMALLALTGSGASWSLVGPALAYLEAALPAIRSAPSLAWGLLGLRAWGRYPDLADHWLAEAAGHAFGRSDAALRLAHLLLAAEPETLRILLAGPAAHDHARGVVKPAARG